MRVKSLAVVLLLSGCQQPARPESANEPERPPHSAKEPGEQPLQLEATGEESQASAPLPSAPVPSSPLPSAAEEIPDQTWSARSADGNAEIRQTAHRDGTASRCTSTSTWSSPDGRDVMWKWNTCIATREHLKFVSPDGMRVLVLDPHPSTLQGNWKDKELATLYSHGVRVKGAKAEALVTAPVEEREPSFRIAWVKGQAGLQGTPPRYVSDGKAVEFETVDGRTFRLGFEGEGFPASPEEKHVFAASAGMYRYEDEKGTVHIVGSRREVPSRYRARAAPVKAEVGILSFNGSIGGEEPGGEEPESPTHAGKEPEPKAPGLKAPNPQNPLEQPPLVSPAELLERAHKTAKQVEEVRRNQEKHLRTEP